MTKNCRISKKPLKQVADLGNIYASTFTRGIQEDLPKGQLRLGICEESGLIQLMDTMDRDTLYRQYWYVSGTNATMTQQLKDVVDIVPHWIKLRDGDHVLDIGCNDGTLFKHYPQNTKLVKVGIDPARNIAELGKKACDLHANDYFEKEVYLDLTRNKRARVITSIAMFYDLDDPHTFVEDIKACLADDGIWVVQMSYTPLMFIQNAFDNIIHEHLEYYTLRSFEYLMKQHDMKVLDVEFNDTNSGTFRVVVTKNTNPVNDATLFYKDIGDYRTDSIREYEKQKGFDTEEACLDFMGRVEKLKEDCVSLLEDLKKQGKSVWGYGASTKGNTLLQYFGLNSELVQGIAERQEQKYDTLTVGSWIPVVSEAKMREAKPDYLLVLPWHFYNEFYYREKEFLSRGGKFIVPLPELQVLGE